jgi:hypothetical protein
MRLRCRALRSAQRERRACRVPAQTPRICKTKIAPSCLPSRRSSTVSSRPRWFAARWASRDRVRKKTHLVRGKRTNLDPPREFLFGVDERTNVSGRLADHRSDRDVDGKECVRSLGDQCIHGFFVGSRAADDRGEPAKRNHVARCVRRVSPVHPGLVFGFAGLRRSRHRLDVRQRTSGSLLFF